MTEEDRKYPDPWMKVHQDALNDRLVEIKSLKDRVEKYERLVSAAVSMLRFYPQNPNPNVLESELWNALKDTMGEGKLEEIIKRIGEGK